MLLSNFHFHELYICEDRGFIAGSNVNLQWDRQQKTLYLGGQLIASLIIMAVLVYQEGNRGKSV